MINKVEFVQEEGSTYEVQPDSVIHKYIERKTKASNRDSKARRSLGNLYALYVICEDYVNGKLEGSTFTELMRRMKSMPFGKKLQNHPLDNRLNDEVSRQYNISDEMLPVQPTDLGNGKKARKISVALLSEKGMDPKTTAQFVISSIDRYIQIIDQNQTAYLNEIESTKTSKEIIKLIEKGFEYNSDARIFEIVSFALLHLHYKQTKVTLTLNGNIEEHDLSLYRTGRTNANDGGIDFVLKPLGKFFQVTETLDFKKYFLDFDKVNRFPMSFVIKTDSTADEVREQIQRDSTEELGEELCKQYMDLFDDIYTLTKLRKILDWVSLNHNLTNQLKEIVTDCFKLEFGLLDQ